MNRMVPTVWEHLDEIAETLPPRRWMLVGGLMVHAHAELAGLLHARPTEDADVVVEVRAGSYAEAAAALGRLGYARHEPLDHRAPFHRFDRPDGQVDLMAPEGTHIRVGTDRAGRARVTFGAQPDHRIPDPGWGHDPYPRSRLGSVSEGSGSPDAEREPSASPPGRRHVVRLRPYRSTGHLQVDEDEHQPPARRVRRPRSLGLYRPREPTSRHPRHPFPQNRLDAAAGRAAATPRTRPVRREYTGLDPRPLRLRRRPEVTRPGGLRAPHPGPPARGVRPLPD